MCILLTCVAFLNLINRLVDENSGQERQVADFVETGCYLLTFVNQLITTYVPRDIELSLCLFTHVTLAVVGVVCDAL